MSNMSNRRKPGKLSVRGWLHVRAMCSVVIIFHCSQWERTERHLVFGDRSKIMWRFRYSKKNLTERNGNWANTDYLNV